MQKGSGMKRILIVDDKEQDRYLLKVLLEHSGYNVDSACNGIEALDNARICPPDCIISDILMPQMDGFMLCREWRNDPVLQKLPFVFYTATYTDPRDEHFALNLGADRFIVKPAEPEELVVTLHEVLTNGSTKDVSDKTTEQSSESYFKEYSEVLVRKLEDKLELFTAIFETDPDAIFLLSPSFTIQNMNRTAENILNIKADQVLDTLFIEIVTPPGKDRNNFTEHLRMIPEKGILSDFQCTLVAENSSQRQILWNGRAIHRGSDLLAGILLIGKDISDQIAAEKQKEELERQLLQSQRMEVAGRLSGGIAHDFNNFLSAIMGFADLIRIEMELPLRQAEYLRQITLCSDRAATLTRQLLAFSRKQILEPKVINCNTIIAGLSPMLRQLTGENIKFFSSLAPDLCTIKADPGRIEQVIMNLAINSRDAMPDGGTLTVITRNSAPLTDTRVPSGTYCVIIVSDSGCGMDETTMARMFEPFFTTKEPGKGTGLGLATVYGIVKQSDGHIFCSSEPGRGTSFTLYFPKIAEPVSTILPSQLQPVVKKGTETILVAEDDPTIRLVTEKLLGNAGYSVITATNSSDALSAAQKYSGSIELLLSDMVMPGISGKELYNKIHSLYPEMKVLFTSGYTSEIADLGTPFLQKPFNQKILLEKVRTVLDSK
jgi:PAS domain S-box-containing protein